MKLKIILLVSLIILVIVYLFRNGSTLNNSENVVLEHVSKGPDKPNLKSELQNKIINQFTKDDSGSKIQKENVDSNTKFNKKIKDNSNEISVESVFISNGSALDMTFIDGILDEDIFNLAIESLQLESQSNSLAQGNRDEFIEIFSNKSSQFLLNNENSDILLSNVQCGVSSCLARILSDGLESWDNFLSEFENTENFFYSSATVNVPQEDGSLVHRLLISVDENVNAISIPMNPDG